MKRALFLDRDGTLIVDVGYPRDPRKIVLLEAALPALRVAKANGFRLVVASNQSGVARGLVTPREAQAVDAEFRRIFRDEGVEFDEVRYCFHGPTDGCECRKPRPGMLLASIAKFELEPGRCLLVGDKPSDTEAGASAHMPTVLLGLREEGGRSWAEVLIHIERLIL